MKKRLRLKDGKWWKHFKITISLYVIACIIFSILIIYSHGLPFDPNLIPIKYYFLLIIPWILLFASVLSLFYAITPYFLYIVKNILSILNSNDLDYDETYKKIKVPKLLPTIIIYIMFFYSFITTIGNYDPILILLISWLLLIIVRSAHYVNPYTGHKIGEFIGAFIVPFGFIILILKMNEFSWKNFKITSQVIFISYFTLMIIGEFFLEIFMDYYTKKRKDDTKNKVYNKLKNNWIDHPSFIAIENNGKNAKK